MKNILVLLLVLGALVLAYLGLTTYRDATASFKVLGLEVSAADQEGRQQAILYAAGALACLVGGFLLYRRK